MNDHTSIPGLLFSCRFLHDECLALLLEDKATFLVRINVSDTAQTGANDFARIDSLRQSFRNGIRNLALHVTLPRRPDLNRFGPVQRLRHVLDPEYNPLLFEQIIENVNELLHLMQGLENIHWMWDSWLGHSGIVAIEEATARGVWRRIEKEWPGREIRWTGQHGMGDYDDERYFDMGPVYS